MARYSAHERYASTDWVTTPTALLVDPRLTPLERNGWQVLRMLSGPDGFSSLTSLSQLRRYLTTTPLGQRAGYETARRVLKVLRLTGWITLIGVQRDPMTGKVMSERYRVHERALVLDQACTADQTLARLLQACLHETGHPIQRIAQHLNQTFEQRQRSDDAETNGARSPGDFMGPISKAVPVGSGIAHTGLSQTNEVHDEPIGQYSTYGSKTYKVRTYPSELENTKGSAPLPSCLAGIDEEQLQELLTSLDELTLEQRQQVLAELEARHRSGGVRNVVAYAFGLIRRVQSGGFRPYALRDRPAVQTVANRDLGMDHRPRPAHRVAPAKRSTPQVAENHIATLRRMLNMPVRVSRVLDDIKAQSEQLSEES
ncbi:STY4528 family pathogenicity island replication protein [Pseudomonas aestiva]|uniref:STY4528 family pathogenicity island replication protein n=1 Tax=Pseudomonas aestiva TaxID=3136739 RepID=UPI0032658537